MQRMFAQIRQVWRVPHERIHHNDVTRGAVAEERVKRSKKPFALRALRAPVLVKKYFLEFPWIKRPHDADDGYAVCAKLFQFPAGKRPSLSLWNPVPSAVEVRPERSVVIYANRSILFAFQIQFPVAGLQK